MGRKLSVQRDALTRRYYLAVVRNGVQYLRYPGDYDSRDYAQSECDRLNALEKRTSNA